MINHSLDNSAPIFVLAEHHKVFFNFGDEPFECGWIQVLAHVHEDLLDHMVSIEVHRAFKNVAVLVQLSQHFFFLLVWEHLESSLDDSAAMLVGWQVKDLSFDLFEYDRMVLLILGSVQLNTLDNIVAVLIFDQFIEVDIWVFEQLVEESFLLIHWDFEA